MPIYSNIENIFATIDTNDITKIIALKLSEKELNTLHPIHHIPLFFITAIDSTPDVLKLLIELGANIDLHLEKFSLSPIISIISNPKTKEYLKEIFAAKVDAILSQGPSASLSTVEINILLGYLKLCATDNNQTNTRADACHHQLKELAKIELKTADFQRMLLLIEYDPVTKIPQIDNFLSSFKEAAKTEAEKEFLALICLNKLGIETSNPPESITPEFEELSKFTLNLTKNLSSPLSLIDTHGQISTRLYQTKAYIKALQEINHLIELYEKIDSAWMKRRLLNSFARRFPNVVHLLTHIQQSEPNDTVFDVKPIIAAFTFINNTISATTFSKFPSNIQKYIVNCFFKHRPISPYSSKNKISLFVSKNFQITSERFLPHINLVNIAFFKTQDFKPDSFELLKTQRDLLIKKFQQYDSDKIVSFIDTTKEAFFSHLTNYFLNAITFYINYSDGKRAVFINKLLFTYSKLLSHLKENKLAKLDVHFDQKLTCETKMVDPALAFIEHILQVAIFSANQPIAYSRFIDEFNTYSYSYSCWQKENPSLPEPSFIINPEDALHFLLPATFTFNRLTYPINLKKCSVGDLQILGKQAYQALIDALKNSRIILTAVEPKNISDSANNFKKLLNKSRQKSKEVFLKLSQVVFIYIEYIYIELIKILEARIEQAPKITIKKLNVDTLMSLYISHVNHTDPNKYFSKISLPFSSHTKNKLESELVLLKLKEDSCLLEFLAQYFLVLLTIFDASSTTSKSDDVHKSLLEDFITLCELSGHKLSTVSAKPPIEENLSVFYGKVAAIANFSYTSLELNKEKLTFIFDDQKSRSAYLNALNQFKIIPDTSNNNSVTINTPSKPQWKKIINLIQDSLTKKEINQPEQGYFPTRIPAFRIENDAVFEIEATLHESFIGILTMLEIKNTLTGNNFTLLDYFNWSKDILQEFRKHIFIKFNPGKIYKPMLPDSSDNNAFQTPLKVESKLTRIKKYEPSVFWTKGTERHTKPYIDSITRLLTENIPDDTESESKPLTTKQLETISLNPSNTEFLLFDKTSATNSVNDLPKSGTSTWTIPTNFLTDLPDLKNVGLNDDLFKSIKVNIASFIAHYSEKNYEMAFYHAARIALLLTQIKYEGHLALFLDNGLGEATFNFKNILLHRADLFLTKPYYLKYILEIYQDYLEPYLAFIDGENTGQHLKFITAKEHPLFKNFSYYLSEEISILYINKPCNFLDPKNIFSTCLDLLISFNKTSCLMDMLYLGELLKSFTCENRAACLKFFDTPLDLTHFSNDATSILSSNSILSILDLEDPSQYLQDNFSFKDYLILLVKLRNLFAHEKEFPAEKALDLLKIIDLNLLQVEFNKINEIANISEGKMEGQETSTTFRYK